MEDSVDSVECPYKKAHIRIFLLDQGPILDWKKDTSNKTGRELCSLFLNQELDQVKFIRFPGTSIYFYVSSAQASA